MKRTTSASGRKFLTSWEGEILKVYSDPVGLHTLGVGHLVMPSEMSAYPLGKNITREESQAFLEKDLARFENIINAEVKVPLTQNQFDALVSLAFNIGVKAFTNASLLDKLNAGNRAGAADGFLSWNRAGGRRNKGLSNRRTAERALFLKPELKVNFTTPEAVTVPTLNEAPATETTAEIMGPIKLPDLGAISDKVFDRITNTSNKISDVQAGVSRSEFLTKQLSKIGSAVTTAATLMFIDYWYITLPILAVFLAVAGYLVYKHREVILGYKTALSPATPITTLHGN